MRLTEISPEELLKILENISNTRSDLIMTTATKLINEGYEKGIEKGIEKGRDETLKGTVKNMLANGLDTRMVARCTGLNPEEVEKYSKM